MTITRKHHSSKYSRENTRRAAEIAKSLWHRDAGDTEARFYAAKAVASLKILIEKLEIRNEPHDLVSITVTWYKIPSPHVPKQSEI